jgi:ABC-2 type transport system permease protein
VAGQECRDLWLGGRGPVLLIGYSVLLSVVTYLTGSNTALNFLEQREAVNLVLQTALAVGGLLTLAVSADAISGERERGTLENLLLAPLERRDLVIGKLIAPLTLWLASFVISLPYLWALGHGVSIVTPAMLLGLLVGTLLAAGLAALGLLVSAVSASNRVSISVSFFLLLAMFAPTQLPSGLPPGWFGRLLERLNPIAAALHYTTAVLVDGHRWTADLPYLIAPGLITALGCATVIAGAHRWVTLLPGVHRE